MAAALYANLMTRKSCRYTCERAKRASARQEKLYPDGRLETAVTGKQMWHLDTDATRV